MHTLSQHWRQQTSVYKHCVSDFIVDFGKAKILPNCQNYIESSNKDAWKCITFVGIAL